MLIGTFYHLHFISTWLQWRIEGRGTTPPSPALRESGCRHRCPSTRFTTSTLQLDHSCICEVSLHNGNLKFWKYSFLPELTLDHQTSLSRPTNTGPWFVSSTHVDPRVLHAHIWDHEVPCAEYLDALYADGTPVCTEKQGQRENSHGAEPKRTRCAQTMCSCWVEGNVVNVLRSDQALKTS